MIRNAVGTTAMMTLFVNLLDDWHCAKAELLKK